MFRSLLAVLVTTFGIFSGAPAAQAGIPYGYYGELTFVAETGISTPTGDGTLSLCQSSIKYHAGFVGFWRSNMGYVLSSSHCEGDMFMEITDGDFAAYQLAGLIPASVPAKASLSTQSIMTGFAGTILLVIALAFKLLITLRGRGSRPRRQKVGQDASAIALAAMCHVAKADGQLDPSEVKMIRRIITAKTGRKFTEKQIMLMVSETADTLSQEDCVMFGEGLSEEERNLVMEAALLVAVADGEIHATEHSLVMNLANGLGIKAEEFRAMLRDIADQLQGASSSTSAAPA